jgi:hypothetical protein
MSLLDEWTQELANATQRRLIKARCISPDWPRVRIDPEERRITRIYVGGKLRFAVKKGFIYEVSSMGLTTKKKQICQLEDWRLWNWEPYYPVRRSLYEWQNAQETKTKAKKKSLPNVGHLSMAEKLEGKTWPYTTTTGREDRRRRRNDPPLGTDPTTKERRGRKDAQ